VDGSPLQVESTLVCHLSAAGALQASTLPAREFALIF